MNIGTRIVTVCILACIPACGGEVGGVGGVEGTGAGRASDPATACPTHSGSSVAQLCALDGDQHVYDLLAHGGDMETVSASTELRMFVRFAPGSVPTLDAMQAWASPHALHARPGTIVLAEDDLSNLIRARLVSRDATSFLWSLGNLGPAAQQVAWTADLTETTKGCGNGASACGYTSRFYLNGVPTQ